MSETAQNAPQNGQNPVDLIHKRLEDLQKRRAELEHELEQQMALALAPLDASIKELTWTLSQLGGEAAAPPEYNLIRRRTPSLPAQQPAPANVAQFAPVSQVAAPPADLPAPKAVMSPKSHTPVANNVAILAEKLGKKG